MRDTFSSVFLTAVFRFMEYSINVFAFNEDEHSLHRRIRVATNVIYKVTCKTESTPATDTYGRKIVQKYL